LNNVIFNNIRAETTDEAKQLAEELKGLYYEVSSKTGENINELFQGLVNHLLGTSVSTNQILSPTPSGSSGKPGPESNTLFYEFINKLEFSLAQNGEAQDGGNGGKPKKTGCC
jgi:hypothetical protein